MLVDLVWSLDSLDSARVPAAKLAMEPARDLTAEFLASADPASEAAPACRREMADSHPVSVALAAADPASEHPASHQAPADRLAVVVAPDQPSDFPVSCRPAAARLSEPPSQALAPSVRQSPASAVLPAAPPPALAVPARLRGCLRLGRIRLYRVRRLQQWRLRAGLDLGIRKLIRIIARLWPHRGIAAHSLQLLVGETIHHQAALLRREMMQEDDLELAFDRLKRIAGGDGIQQRQKSVVGVTENPQRTIAQCIAAALQIRSRW